MASRFLLLLLPALAFAGEAGFQIAALTLTPEPWNKEANFQKLARFTRQAAAQGAQVVVAPEGYLEGYVGNEHRTPDLTWEKYSAAGEPLDGELLQRVAALARELRIYLLLGFAEKRDGKMFNSAVIFSPGGKVASHYSKSHTADDEPFNTKGASFPVLDTPFGKWGTLICYDRQLPETSRILAIKGAQLILVPAWGGYGETNDIMMRVRAYENGVWLAFVHPKRALFINPAGKIVAQDAGEFDQIVMTRIDLSGHKKSTHLQRRRPGIYSDLLSK